MHLTISTTVPSDTLLIEDRILDADDVDYTEEPQIIKYDEYEMKAWRPINQTQNNLCFDQNASLCLYHTDLMVSKEFRLFIDIEGYGEETDKETNRTIQGVLGLAPSNHSFTYQLFN